MSEQDRERAYRLGAEQGLHPSDDGLREITDEWAEEFAAIRDEERSAIVAYLRADANARRLGSGAFGGVLGALALEDVSDQIERGEHRATVNADSDNHDEGGGR